MVMGVIAAKPRPPLILPVVWLLGLIWFDTSNVVRCTFHELPYQFIGLSLKIREKGIKTIGKNSV